MEYELTCFNFNSTYFGQTMRSLAKRVVENRKKDSPAGQHLLVCGKKQGKAELLS